MAKINWLSLASYPAPWRLAIFILMLLGMWVPIAAPIYLLIKDSNLVSLLVLPLLYGEFIGLIKFWGDKVYQQPKIFSYYGLLGTRRNGWELLAGLGIGAAIAFSLFVVEGFLGWARWQLSPAFTPKIILEALLVGLGIGFAEELFFRGWLLAELERDYAPTLCLWVTALFYALLHFIKPLAEAIRTFPQFPGLVLLGLILVWAKRGSKGRLGLPIGLHGGLVGGYYIINVGQLVQYTGQVPEWITGADRNPLAGLLGLIFLGAIAFLMRQRAQAT